MERNFNFMKKKMLEKTISLLLVLAIAANSMIIMISASGSNSYEYVSNGDFSSGNTNGWRDAGVNILPTSDAVNSVNGSSCAMAAGQVSYTVKLSTNGNYQLSVSIKVFAGGKTGSIGLYDSNGMLVEGSEAKTASTANGTAYNLTSSFSTSKTGSYSIKVSPGEEGTFFTFDDVSLLGPETVIPTYEYLSDGKFASGTTNGWTGIEKISLRTTENALMFNANYADVNSNSVTYKALSLQAGNYSLSCDFLKVVADNIITMALYDSNGELVPNSTTNIPVGQPTWATKNISSEFAIPSNGNYTIKLSATSASSDIYYCFSNVSLLGPAIEGSKQQTLEIIPVATLNLDATNGGQFTVSGNTATYNLGAGNGTINYTQRVEGTYASSINKPSVTNPNSQNGNALMISCGSIPGFSSDSSKAGTDVNFPELSGKLSDKSNLIGSMDFMLGKEAVFSHNFSGLMINVAELVYINLTTSRILIQDFRDSSNVNRLDATISLSPDKWYTLKYKIIGERILCNLYIAGETEPSAYKYGAYTSGVLKNSFGISFAIHDPVTKIPFTLQNVSFSTWSGSLASDSSLCDILIGNTHLTDFNPKTANYTIKLNNTDYDFSNLTVQAIPTCDKSTVTITQPPTIPGTATIIVKSFDEKTSKEYTINMEVDDSKMVSFEIPPLEVPLGTDPTYLSYPQEVIAVLENGRRVTLPIADWNDLGDLNTGIAGTYTIRGTVKSAKNLAVLNSDNIKAELTVKVVDAYQIFVDSQNGSDNNSGLEFDKKIKTLAKAKELVQKELNRQKDAGESSYKDIAVNLSGEFVLDQTLKLDAKMSGNGNKFVTFRKASGASKATISGGYKVNTGWNIDKEIPNVGVVYKTTLPNNLNFTSQKIRDIYLNGVRQTMSEWSGRLGTSSYTSSLDSYGDPIGWRLTSDTMNAFNSLQLFNSAKTCSRDIELYVTGNVPGQKSFYTTTYSVESFSEEGNDKTIIMQQPYFNYQYNLNGFLPPPQYDPNIFPGARPDRKDYEVHNAYEFIDKVSEFYYNSNTRELYLCVNSDMNISTADVTIPTLDTLIDIAGDNITNKVKNINFFGITFSYARNQLYVDGNSSGYAATQSGGVSKRRDDFKDFGKTYFGTTGVLKASINVEHATNINIQKNAIVNVAGLGVSFENDVSNSKINANIFSFVGGGVVSVGSPAHTIIGDGVRKAADNSVTRTGGSVSGDVVNFGAEGTTLKFTQNSNDQNQLNACTVGRTTNFIFPKFQFNYQNTSGKEVKVGLYIGGSQVSTLALQETPNGLSKICLTDFNIAYGAEVEIKMITTGLSADKVKIEYFGRGDYAYNEEMFCTNIDVTNNITNNVGCSKDIYMQNIITLYRGTHINISHNELNGAAYGQISAGWGWYIAPSFDYTQNNIKINYNKIEGVMEVLGDSAFIYTLSNMPNSEIRGNVLTKWPTITFGGFIYLDEGTMGVSVYENVCYNINPPGGRWLNVNNNHNNNWGELNCNITNNYVVDDWSSIQNLIPQSNIFDPNNKPEGVTTIESIAGISPAYSDLKGAFNIEAKSVSPVTIYTVKGNYPMLPSSVNVTKKDGTIEKRNVSWSTIPQSQYNTVGKFTVSGTVFGVTNGMNAVATVIVKNGFTDNELGITIASNTPETFPSFSPFAFLLAEKLGITQEMKDAAKSVDNQATVLNAYNLAIQYENGDSFTNVKRDGLMVSFKIPSEYSADRVQAMQKQKDGSFKSLLTTSELNNIVYATTYDMGDFILIYLPNTEDNTTETTTNPTQTTTVSEFTTASVENILKSATTETVSIRVKNTDVFTKEIQQLYIRYNKKAKFEVVNQDGEVELIWQFPLLSETNQDMPLGLNAESENKQKITKHLESALSYQIISFVYSGSLPDGTIVFVKNKPDFTKKDNLKINLYLREDDTLQTINTKIMFTSDASYFAFNLVHCSDYIIAKYPPVKAADKPSDSKNGNGGNNNNLIIIFSIIAAFILLGGGLTAFIIIKKKKSLKNNS